MRKLRMIAALMTTAAMTVSVTACGNRGAAQTTAAAADYSVQETTAADAAKDGAKLLQPTNDTVKYSDGTTEEVYGFDVPVEALDKEFDLAILGTKGTWYDHKVSVSDAQKN